VSAANNKKGSYRSADSRSEESPGMGTMLEEWVAYESYQIRKNASTKELYIGSER